MHRTFLHGSIYVHVRPPAVPGLLLRVLLRPAEEIVYGTAAAAAAPYSAKSRTKELASLAGRRAG